MDKSKEEITHVHHWQVKYDDIDGGCIVVYAVCTECGERLNNHQLEKMLNDYEAAQQSAQVCTCRETKKGAMLQWNPGCLVHGLNRERTGN